jgi:hypothetical protein
MKKIVSHLLIASALLFSTAVLAQDKDEEFKPHGQLWGYAFGDFAYKAHADSLNRGGSNQYTGVKQGSSMFQFRRIYLGYNYEISKKFSAEFLLAAEDDFSGGDLLQNNKLAPYVKLANIRWKDIWKGTDLVIGQANTPAFAKSGRNSQTSEEMWSYRSIERTITDVRRTPSFDMGIALQGTLPHNDNFGYNVMAANGQSAKPENDIYKWFYGDVWGKFLDKKLIVDFYADYERLNWTDTWHHDRSMAKLFVAYTTPKLTVGMEYYINNLMGDDSATRISDGKVDMITTKASGLSLFARGPIVKNKLGFFARFDYYNPSGNNDNSIYKKYKPLTSQYDPNTQEQFITAGLDFTPIKNVHFMPNIWYNAYNNQGPANLKNDYDMVYRFTFYYVYGK